MIFEMGFGNYFFFFGKVMGCDIYLISLFKYEWLHGKLAGVVVLYDFLKWGLGITFFFFLDFLRKVMGRNVWFQFLMMNVLKLNWDCCNVWFLKWG